MAINVYIKNKNTKIGKAFANYIGMQKIESYPNGNSGIARESLKGELAELLPQCVVDKVAGNAWVCGSITIDPNKMNYQQRKAFLKAMELVKCGELKTSVLHYVAYHQKSVQDKLSQIVDFLNKKLADEVNISSIEFDGQYIILKTAENVFYPKSNWQETSKDNMFCHINPFDLLPAQKGENEKFSYFNIMGGLVRLNPNFDSTTYMNVSWKSGWNNAYYRQDLLESFDFGKLIKKIKEWKK